MPKLKTHSGMKKRFKLTASGRIKHRHAFRSHILVKKPAKRRRPLRALGILKNCDARNLRKWFGVKTKARLPYAAYVKEQILLELLNEAQAQESAHGQS